MPSLAGPRALRLREVHAPGVGLSQPAPAATKNDSQRANLHLLPEFYLKIPPFVTDLGIGRASLASLMNLLPAVGGRRGLTLLEVVILIGLVSLVLLLLVPALLPSRSRNAATRVQCINNLRHVAFAYRVFASENDDKFPFRITNSLAYGNVTQAWLHFQTLSNELGSARNLICPSDRSRLDDTALDFLTGPAAGPTSLSSKGNAAVSYTASLDADKTQLSTILTSDRHFATNSNNLVERVYLTSTNLAAPSWTSSQHNGAGSFALSDSSVQQVTSADLAHQVRQQGIATNRLPLPLLP